MWKNAQEKNWPYRKARVVSSIVTCITCLCFICIMCWLWTQRADHHIRYTPDYPMEDISYCFRKEMLEQQDYELLYRQTGLSKLAVDALEEERAEEILLMAQECFFAEVETTCECQTLICNESVKILNENKRDSNAWIRPVIPVIEEGDILITFNSHFLGWRNGHAGIVIDAKKGLTLEALRMGENSTILSLDNWTEKPSFAVLRLKGATREERKDIADYALETLNDVPYRLLSGVWRSRSEKSESPTGTQCSHLIWFAYRHFGYDLDSDGGLIVTPRDIFDSPFLEVVQVYGIERE